LNRITPEASNLIDIE